METTIEHVTITELENGYYRLVPDKGYVLINKSLPQNTYSEAVTKNPQEFEAVAIDNL